MLIGCCASILLGIALLAKLDAEWGNVLMVQGHGGRLHFLGRALGKSLLMSMLVLTMIVLEIDYDQCYVIFATVVNSVLGNGLCDLTIAMPLLSELHYFLGHVFLREGFEESVS